MGFFNKFFKRSNPKYAVKEGNREQVCLPLEPEVESETYNIKIKILSDFIFKFYIYKENRGFFHHHGDIGKYNARRIISEMGNRGVDFEAKLKNVMKENKSGNYYPGSLKACLLAYYKSIKENRTPEIILSELKALSPSEIKQQYYAEIGKKPKDAELFTFARLNR